MAKPSVFALLFIIEDVGDPITNNEPRSTYTSIGHTSGV